MRESTINNITTTFLLLLLIIPTMIVGYMIGSLRAERNCEPQETNQEKCERTFNRIGSPETIESCVNLLNVLDEE